MDARSIEGIGYATLDGGRELKLDLHLPDGDAKAPLVMWIHGGGWQNGSRKNVRPAFLIGRGYAVASVEYRFSQEAIFPAQIHDCKAALRWLRANAASHGVDASRVVVGGGSAGGLLAVLLGCSEGYPELEGELGDHASESCAVDGILNWFGPMDLALRGRTNPHRHQAPDGPSWRLLGGDVGGELEALASPSTHVDERSPPLLTIHGTADTAVLPIQATRICDAYAQHRRVCELHFEDGAGHGDQRLFEGRFQEVVVDFLERVVAQAVG